MHACSMHFYISFEEIYSESNTLGLGGEGRGVDGGGWGMGERRLLPLMLLKTKTIIPSLNCSAAPPLSAPNTHIRDMPEIVCSLKRSGITRSIHKGHAAKYNCPFFTVLPFQLISEATSLIRNCVSVCVCVCVCEC